jgi:hypothetical protein
MTAPAKAVDANSRDDERPDRPPGVRGLSITVVS